MDNRDTSESAGALSLTVMVVLMSWLSDKSMEFKGIGLRESNRCKPREAFKEAFSVTF